MQISSAGSPTLFTICSQEAETRHEVALRKRRNAEPRGDASFDLPGNVWLFSHLDGTIRSLLVAVLQLKIPKF